MAFCEFRFFAFFLAVFAVYWILPRNILRKFWLLGCSFAFYAAWDWRFLSLILFSTMVDYLAGIGLASTNRLVLRRALLSISLISNLGLLAFFKYFGFFVESCQELMQTLGLPFNTSTLNIILPVGISFYTFQTLSYTIDVYRGKLQPSRNLLDFALFVSFFPQLVAGPIVRAKSFLPQLDRLRRWKWTRMQLGMFYVVMGLFKKLAIADRMACYCDPVFSDVAQYDSGTLWIAAVAFAVQVYCDFSGYSDMAIGVASFLGYRLTKNFEMPLVAVNVSDFWRRWHISLSSWVRDYVFFPLGGSRHGAWITNRNLLITMTLVGLWHGAAWTFVLFGLIQGVFLAIHGHFRVFCVGRPRLTAALNSRAGTALRITVTFLSFCMSLVVFRANTVSDGILMLQHMMVPTGGLGVPTNERGFWYAMLVLGLAHWIGHNQKTFARALEFIPAPVRGLGYASVFTLALVLSPEIDQAFIYFQF
jgi:alginate O-acetyltransferase complex protein AlgI